MNVTSSLKILIVEDNNRTVTLLTKFLENLQHSVIIAENGQIAFEKFIAEKPDLILTDLNMPVVDGITLIKQIREASEDQWVPVLILSAYGEEKDIIAGLEAGADDYLTKPINMSILRAKIEAMHRTVLLQRNNEESLRSLEKANQALHDEQVLAKQLADKILKNTDLQVEELDSWLCPAAQLSGDFIAAKKVGDKLYAMVADSTGHGLAAALPTLAMARIFNAMSSRGFGLEAIVTEMNTETHEMLPADRFVAAAAFIIDFRHNIIECWNGGLPPALIVNRDGKVIHRFESNHLALSILDSNTFDTSTEMYHWIEPCQLVIYSDGVTEAECPVGNHFGTERFMEIMQGSGSDSRFKEIQSAVLAHIDAEHGVDDISLAVVDCQ